jgi:hypothetical protein
MCFDLQGADARERHGLDSFWLTVDTVDEAKHAQRCSRRSHSGILSDVFRESCLVTPG